MAWGRWHFLEGEGVTFPMWDCPDRHHATTDPQEWDHLKILRLLADLRDAIGTTPDAHQDPVRRDHDV